MPGMAELSILSRVRRSVQEPPFYGQQRFALTDMGNSSRTR